MLENESLKFTGKCQALIANKLPPKEQAPNFDSGSATERSLRL